MASREEQLKTREEHPDTFVAVDPGDSITGTLMDVKEAWSDARTNGGRSPERGWYPLLVIGTPWKTSYAHPKHVGPIKWHAFSNVAENEVLRLMPYPGEHITVTYDGISKNAKKGQNPAKLFTLTVEGRSAEDAAKNAYANLKNRGGRGGVQAVTPTVQPSIEPEQQTLEQANDDDIPF